MDASRRSCHVYGKTQSGKSALNLAKGGLPIAARQLLILLDGQRTVGELSDMLGLEAVEMSLAQLEAQGYAEVVRHFPEEDESPGAAATPTPAPARDRGRHRAPRDRLGVLFVLAIPVTISAIAWALFGPAIESPNPDVAAEPVQPPASGIGAAPAEKRSEAATRPAPPHEAARPAPQAIAAAGPPAPSPALSSAGPELHVRTQVTPRIPQSQRDLGVTSGRVVVVLHVKPDGTVERVELVSATPPEVCDQEMLRAFGQWTFDPPGVRGRMTVQVDIVPPDGSPAGTEAALKPAAATAGRSQ